VIFLSSCSVAPVLQQFEQKGECLKYKTVLEGTVYRKCVEREPYVENLPKVLEIQSQELLEVQVPKNPIVVAVYPTAFTDQTGQRKSNSEFALFSSAITQAPSHLLIRALKHTADGNFFRVAERVGLDNLTKERQLIRSARQDEDDAKPLMPLLFAGVLMEGAVVGYDTNIKSGGIGARYLGLGASKQYRIDSVTLSLRMVSVATGEVLIDVLVSKQIYSYGKSQDVFKFIEAGTELVELEGGDVENDSVTIALQRAIEDAVLEIIKIGYDRKYWEKKYE
jgi:curli production assembly/transport component CsgG|tara:strand:+ start:1270 stop:2109 length:840 start_codon:yes stop_codon:yes gene_type:complete